MDREALVRRNRAMAEAFHAVPLKHQARRRLLRIASLIPTRPARLPSRERILLIRPDHLGDVLLTTPAIRALRAARPQAELHALAGPWSAEILAAYAEIDQVLTLPFPGFSRTPKADWKSPYQLVLQAAGWLRRIGYSSAVILRPDHWWGALLAARAGIAERIGYAHPDVTPFLTESITLQPEHAIQQNLRLVERWTGTVSPDRVRYSFPVDPIDRAYIDGYLEEWNIGADQRVICIHPGTGTWVKHWVEENWAKVADTLAEQLDGRIVLSGGDREIPLAQRIAGQMKHKPVIAAGDTRVGQLAALFQRAKVVLGPDSGPLHLAAAVGAPTVALYGPADPVEFGPWGDPQRQIALTSDIGCRPCRILDWDSDDPAYHPCLREITVGRVLEAARRASRT